MLNNAGKKSAAECEEAAIQLKEKRAHAVKSLAEHRLFFYYS